METSNYIYMTLLLARTKEFTSPYTFLLIKKIIQNLLYKKEYFVSYHCNNINR